MMFKRGASHADWAVSMGIFIIYILSMFIMVQPGAQKVFREDNLIKIVEEGIKDYSEYTVEKTPIYIKLAAGTPAGTYDMKLSKNLNMPLPDGNNDDFKMVSSETSAEVPFNIAVANGQSSQDVYFTYAFGEPAKIYRFDIYYLKATYNTDPTGTPDANPLNDLADGAGYDYNFGPTEKIIGYDEATIAGLCSTPDYKAFKDSLGYPLTKDFRIYYVRAGAPGESVPVQYDYDTRIQVCEEAEPYEQASVFVKELVESFMDTDGVKTQARINIRVW